MTEKLAVYPEESTNARTLKLKARFVDRVGIVADISAGIARYHLNIVLMEVIREEDEAIIFMEIEGNSLTGGKEQVIDFFTHLSDFKEVMVIETLPQEERANRFKVVLDNMSDGVISIDRNGNLTTINKLAEQALMIEPDKVIGKSIRSLNLLKYPILECLDGKKLENIKQNLIIAERRYQYISTCKPIRDSHDQIIGAVEIAKDIQEVKKMAQSFADANTICFTDIIGNNSAIREAIALAERMAPTDMSIAIHGASGTGKELFARSIHTASGRSGPFVPINCAALPEQLLEGELFGYVGGAFTGGAKNGKPGLFETARKGTVFLDEIAELPLPSQAKLLRLIQERAVRRIGGSKEIPIDVRILTATNKSLEQLVEKGEFRKDLYYRINVLPIHIPPLKDRLDDIPLLVDHFLFGLAGKLGKQSLILGDSALAKLQKHSWPGNVRELSNVIERAAVFCGNNCIDIKDILFSYELGEADRHRCTPSSEDSESLKAMLCEYEKTILLKALARENSIRQTARALGISHPALLKKLKKYAIHPN